MKQQKIKRIYQGRNVVTVSDAVGEIWWKSLPCARHKLNTIYNPFDITALRAEAEADSERPDGDYLIHVGRFHPGKRHDRLLEAYAQSGIDAPLVLLGQENRSKSSACASWQKRCTLTIGCGSKAFRKPLTVDQRRTDAGFELR